MHFSLLLIKMHCGYFTDSDCPVYPKVVVMACREFEMGKVGLLALQTEQLLHLFAQLALIYQHLLLANLP